VKRVVGDDGGGGGWRNARFVGNKVSIRLLFHSVSLSSVCALMSRLEVKEETHFLFFQFSSRKNEHKSAQQPED
jgi:hypothetical protein